MQFTIGRDELVSELKACERFAEKRSTIPILTGVLIRAEDNLELAATDGQLAIHSTLSASIASIGSAVLPASRFSNYTQSLPSGSTVSIEADSGWAKVRCGKSYARIPVLETELFPEVEIAGDPVCETTARQISDSFPRIIIAIDAQESRFTTKVMCVDIHGSDIRLAATDTKRLAVTGPSMNGKRLRILLPREAAVEIARSCSGLGDLGVSITQNESWVHFMIGTRRLSVRRISEGFPDYERILSVKRESAVSLSAADLLASIERTLQFVDDKFPSIILGFGKTEDLVVSAQSPGKGEFSDSVHLESTPPRQMDVIFNPFFIVDFLRVAGDKKIDFLFQDSTSTCEFRITGEEYRYAVMPKHQ